MIDPREWFSKLREVRRNLIREERIGWIWRIHRTRDQVELPDKASMVESLSFGRTLEDSGLEDFWEERWLNLSKCLELWSYLERGAKGEPCKPNQGNLVTKPARMEPKGRDLAPKSFGRKPCKLLPLFNATRPISFACARGGHAPSAKCRWVRAKCPKTQAHFKRSPTLYKQLTLPPKIPLKDPEKDLEVFKSL